MFNAYISYMFIQLSLQARVLDIVRASIVVDDIDQVVKVVEIIEKDRDVEIGDMNTCHFVLYLLCCDRCYFYLFFKFS